MYSFNILTFLKVSTFCTTWGKKTEKCGKKMALMETIKNSLIIRREYIYSCKALTFT